MDRAEAKRLARAALRKTLKLLGWAIPAALLIFAILRIANREPEPYSQKPEEMVMTYMDLAMRYAPPSLQQMDRETWNALLNMFTSEDRKWVNENLKFLAWMGAGQMDKDFLKASELERIQMASRFLLAQGPRQAMTVRGTKYTEDQKAVTVSLTNFTGNLEVMAVWEDGRWRLKGLWGIPARFAAQHALFKQKQIG